MMLFLLDSNVFINASRLYYHPDVAPTFLGVVDRADRIGYIASVSRVKDELMMVIAAISRSGHRNCQVPSGFNRVQMRWRR